jgi:cytochrome c-type biogenesis protein CcmH
MRHFLNLFFLLAWLASPALAVLPDEVLHDAKLEARARVISQELRCLVCQNQSIDDSNADLAKDLRLIVRERLVAGESNEQVFEYVKHRFGNYVLLNPPMQRDTLFLWLAPFLMFALALGVVVLYLRGQPVVDDAE